MLGTRSSSARDQLPEEQAQRFALQHRSGTRCARPRMATPTTSTRSPDGMPPPGGHRDSARHRPLAILFTLHRALVSATLSFSGAAANGLSSRRGRRAARERDHVGAGSRLCHVPSCQPIAAAIFSIAGVDSACRRWTSAVDLSYGTYTISEREPVSSSTPRARGGDVIQFSADVCRSPPSSARRLHHALGHGSWSCHVQNVPAFLFAVARGHLERPNLPNLEPLLLPRNRAPTGPMPYFVLSWRGSPRWLKSRSMTKTRRFPLLPR